MIFKLLIINRKAPNCGVGDYGRRVYDIIKQSKILDVNIVEISTAEEYIDAISRYTPDIVIYNYYPVIMPFITDSLIRSVNVNILHVAIYHELGINFNPDIIIDVDSTAAHGYLRYPSPRPLFENVPINLGPTNNKVVTIGSFGFGFPDKNFPKLAQLVCDQYDTACIRINSSFATFGDADGSITRREMQKVRNIVESSGKNIKLEINHDYLSHNEIIQFLNQNDINIFMYDMHETRSLSSCIDYALSARRPIGISKSKMFRHISHVYPSILVDDVPIQSIINNGIHVFESVYQMHSNQKLISLYEWIAHIKKI